MAGMVARTIAGPGVVLSFFIAAVASIFSGEQNTYRFARAHFNNDRNYNLLVHMCAQVLVMPNLAFVCHTHPAPRTCIHM